MSSIVDALELMPTLEVEDRKQVFTTLKRERVAKEAAQKEEMRLLPNSHWSKVHILKRIPNPTEDAYEQKIYIPEFTFVGAANQPDFGEVLLTFYPSKYTIELKSLKIYKDAFRGSMASYERLANVMYEDLMAVYEPMRLRIMMRLRPRGGVSSCLTIDSDWSIRGGREQFADWKNNTDRFGFEVSDAVRV